MPGILAKKQQKGILDPSSMLTRDPSSSNFFSAAMQMFPKKWNERKWTDTPGSDAAVYHPGAMSLMMPNYDAVTPPHEFNIAGPVTDQNIVSNVLPDQKGSDPNFNQVRFVQMMQQINDAENKKTLTSAQADQLRNTLLNRDVRNFQQLSY